MERSKEPEMSRRKNTFLKFRRLPVFPREGTNLFLNKTRLAKGKLLNTESGVVSASRCISKENTRLKWAYKWEFRFKLIFQNSRFQHQKYENFARYQLYRIFPLDYVNEFS